MRRFRFLLILVLIVCQKPSFANEYFGLATPIAPGKSLNKKYLGAVFGLGQNIQNGTAFVSCENCNFTNGLGFGYTLGAIYEQQFTGDFQDYWHHFKWGAMLRYDSKGLVANFKERTEEYFSEYDMKIPILMKHIDDMSLSSVGMTPFVTYNPINFFFLRLGVNVDYLLQNNMEHKIELLEKTKTLPNGEKVYLYIPTANPKQKKYNYVVEEGEIKELNKIQIALMPAIGFDINLSEKLLLSTSFNYSIPFTKTSNFGENFNISTWRLFFELKYNLTKSESIYKKPNKRKKYLIKRKK